MGREADGQVSAAYGLVEDAELQRYVSDIGLELAAASEKPDLPWSFKVVDDPIVNAFALPGGFIYVTRGILAQFDSEAELAGVLGHEIGHVTARHSASQMSRQQLLQVGLVGGMILSETVAEYAQLGALGIQVLNLRYSRGDETQSDELGLRYMTRAGYDPDALIGVFDMLAAVSGGAEGRLPEWQLTHPYPENREDNIRDVIAEQGLPREGTIDRDAYLNVIDGMIYGQNPREGYFVGSRFLHPEMAFELTFPSGWQTVNQRTMVGGISPAEDAVITLTVADGGATPALEAGEFLRQDGVSGGPVRESVDGGLEWARAPFTITTQEGVFRGEVAFVRKDGTTFRLMGYSADANFGRYAGTVSDALGSFAGVTDPAVLNVEPLRLDIVTLSEPMSLTRFHDQTNPPIDVEALARLNRSSPGAVVSGGTRIKTVVGRSVG